MRSLFSKVKFATIIIALLILFQSCVVYRSTPISIDEAVRSETKILVINTENKRLPFKRIEKTDTTYYGIKKHFSKEIRVSLNQNEIKKIRPMNPGLSTLGTFGLFLIGIAAIIIPIKLIELQNDLNDIGDAKF